MGNLIPYFLLGFRKFIWQPSNQFIHFRLPLDDVFILDPFILILHLSDRQDEL